MRARARLLLILVGTLMLCVPMRVARAHASLLSSSPADGARLAASPVQVRLLFSEPIVTALSHVMLLDENGREEHIPVTGDPHEVRAILARLPALAAGGYRVIWHIVSADGHPVSGSTSFEVGAGGAPPPVPSMEADRAEMDMHVTVDHPMVAGAALIPALLRGIALSALLALCGLAGFSAYADTTSARQMKLCGWLSVAATVLLSAHLASWLMHVSPMGSLDASVVESALSREVGLNELLRLIFTALAAWAVLLARRLRLAFAFALAAVMIGGLIGHPAAIDPLVSVPAKALHLAGVAFWFGGLLWILTADSSSIEMARTASLVSRMALGSIVLVAMTGIVQSVLFLPAWTDLFASAYGLTLLGKVAGLAALALFGMYHKYRLLPRLGEQPANAAFQRSLRREVALMVAVIMLGGFLAYVPTPSLELHSSHPTQVTQ